MGIRTGRALTVCALALAIAAPAAAQDQAVDAPKLEALCAQDAPDATALQDCLDVVHSILVPGSGPVTTAPAPSLAALVQGASVGTTLTGDGVDVTLVEADWAPEPGFLAPAQGNQYVSVLARYLGTAGDATHNFFHLERSRPGSHVVLRHHRDGALPGVG